MSGGKGGSQTQQTQIPDWAKEPTIRNIARAEEAQKIGYMPYYGADIAGFTPMEQMAMQSDLQSAQAFGLAPAGQYSAMAGMPQPQQFDLGGGQMVSGYSATPLYEQAVAEVARKQPTFAQRYGKLYE